MLPENTISPLRKIALSRDDALAIAIGGPMTSADVENFYGLLDAAAASYKTFDVIVIFDEYDGIDWTAFLRPDTVKMGHDLKSKIKRYAIVGGPGWLSLAINFLHPALSADIRWFDTNAIENAWLFIDAHPK